MTPNQKWNVPGSSQPSESTAPQNEENIPSTQKPAIEPTPSQVGKFQAAVGQQGKKKNLSNKFEETIPTKEEAEAAAESSLFDLAHSSMKTPISSKPSTKQSVQPLISPIAGTGVGEAELEDVETLKMPSGIPAKAFDTSITTPIVGAPQVPPKTKPAPFFTKGTTTLDTTSTVNGPQITPKTRPTPFFSKETSTGDTSTTSTKSQMPPQTKTGPFETKGTTKIDITTVGTSQVPPKAKTSFFSAKTNEKADTTTVGTSQVSPKAKTSFFGAKTNEKADTTTVDASGTPPKAKTSFFGAKTNEKPDTTTVDASGTPPKAKTSFFDAKTNEKVDTTTVDASGTPPKAKTSFFDAKTNEKPDTTTVDASGTPPKAKTPPSLSLGEQETKTSEEIPVETPASSLAAKGSQVPQAPISKEDVLAAAFQTIAEKVSIEEQTHTLATDITKAKTAKAKLEKNLAQAAIQQPLPTRTPQAQVAQKQTELSPNAHQLTLQQLVNQVAEHITTMTTKHLETLTVDIKYPPLFAGAQITITQFKQARGEFNITFNNLSPEARLLIESGAQQRRLNDALTEKGYKIHIISIEAPHIESAAFETTPSGYSREGNEGGTETGGNMSGEDEHGHPSGQ